MKRYYLVFEIASVKKIIYPLLEATTIGRDTSNSLVLSEATASRKHARVRFWQGSWMVEDLGSANGIIINGERMEKTYIKPGDSFKIGETTFALTEREIAESKDPLHTTVLSLSTINEDLQNQGTQEETERQSEKLADAISEVPFFAPLKDTEREDLAENAIMHVFNAGQIVIQQGDPGRSVYIILDGRVKVFTADHAGNELELATLGAGQFFGEMSLVSGKPRVSSVATLDSSVLIELSFPSMAKIIKQNAAVKNILVEYYKTRKSDTQEKRARTIKTELAEHRH
jgi:pSer/pThr/pTyr-binding forkhead associated (FHA) protein